MSPSNFKSDIDRAREELLQLIGEDPAAASAAAAAAADDDDNNDAAERTRRGQRVKEILDEFPELCREKNDFYGGVALHMALDSGAPFEVLEQLVTCFPKSLRLVNTIFRQTPLNFACSDSVNDFGLQVYELLLSPEAARSPDKMYRLPLHNYLLYNNISRLSLEVVQLLWNAYPESIVMVDFKGNTPLHLLLSHSCRESVLPILRFLVQASPESLKMQNKDGQAPLHIACERWQCVDLLPVICFLVEEYPDALRLKDDRHRTPLHIVCTQFRLGDSTSVAQYLVQACPEVLEPPDGRDFSTPLHDVCKSYTLPAVPLLEVLAISEQAVTAAKDDNGRTPLHSMSFYGNVTQESLDILLKKCPELPRMQDDQGQLPLLSALKGSLVIRRSNYDQTVKCLLKAFPGGVIMPDNDGVTPLEFACENNVRLGLIYQLLLIDPIAAFSHWRE